MFIRSKAHVFLEPLSRFLIPVAYTFSYAKWYHDNGVPQHSVRTQTKFGYENRYELYKFLVETENLKDEPITYLEFGVAYGQSLEWWIKNNQNPSSKFIGFDTFDGLPEKWWGCPKGAFSSGGKPPAVNDSCCSYQIGLFQDTLNGFLEQCQLDTGRSVIHLDADLYSSTLFVLTALASRLKTKDIILFDEFADVTNEFRAYLDFSSAFPAKLKLVGATNHGNKAAFVVEET